MDKKQKEAQALIIKSVEDAINAVVGSCEAQAREWGTQQIPIGNLKLTAEVFIKSYKEEALKRGK